MPRDTAGLGSSPFDRLYWGNRYYFLLLPLLRCFSSRRSPHALSVMAGSLPPGCPIRISEGPRVFAPRLGFSQLVTSFLASESLGIPPAPLFTVRIPYSTTSAFMSRLFRSDHSKRSFALLFVSLVLASRGLTLSLASIMSLCSSS